MKDKYWTVRLVKEASRNRSASCDSSQANNCVGPPVVLPKTDPGIAQPQWSSFAPIFILAIPYRPRFEGLFARWTSRYTEKTFNPKRIC
jgi:hypothetical protein